MSHNATALHDVNKYPEGRKSSNDISTDQAISILNNLGLTSVQARIYLHLFLESEQSARSIVESLGIDRIDVYRALQRLQSMGLVDVYLGNPNKYAASSHSTALRLLLERKEAEVESARRRASFLEEMLSTMTKSHKDSKEGSDQFYVLKRGYAVLDAIINMENKAQKDIRKVVNSVGMGYHLLFGIADAEMKIVQKGVKIRLITDQKARAIQNYSRIAEIRYAGNLRNSLRYIIVDNNAIMLSMAPNVTDEKDSVALLTNNGTLIQALSSFYDRSWNGFKQ